jgi:hypothetical protein
LTGDDEYQNYVLVKRLLLLFCRTFWGLQLTQFDDMESAGSRPKDDVSLPKGRKPIATPVFCCYRNCCSFSKFLVNTIFQSCGDFGVLIEGRMLGAMPCSNDDQDY